MHAVCTARGLSAEDITTINVAMKNFLKAYGSIYSVRLHFAIPCQNSRLREFRAIAKSQPSCITIFEIAEKVEMPMQPSPYKAYSAFRDFFESGHE